MDAQRNAFLQYAWISQEAILHKSMQLTVLRNAGLVGWDQHRQGSGFFSSAPLQVDW